MRVQGLLGNFGLSQKAPNTLMKGPKGSPKVVGNCGAVAVLRSKGASLESCPKVNNAHRPS